MPTKVSEGRLRSPLFLFPKDSEMNKEINETDAEFVSHEPCEACGSSDANALYSDGSMWCFSCQTYKPSDDDSFETTVQTKVKRDLIEGDYVELRGRGLTEATCRKFGYMVGEVNGQPVHLATYKTRQGQAVAQKVRTKDKKFSVVGDKDQMGLFGWHLWSSGKKLVVTEGEICCLSVSQVQNHKFATCSVPHGAQSAKKHLLKEIDYLSNFEEIILMFDQDTAGIEAAKACAEVLPLGKTKIAVLPHKDANECLMKGEAGAIITAIHQAQQYRPDGIVAMADMRDVVAAKDAESPIKYPYPKLNEMLKGIRTGLVTIAAGSGVGKSTLVRELAYRIHQDGFTVGMMMLEESTKRTAQGLVGIHINKNITIDNEAATDEEITTGFDDLMSKSPIYLFDHFGSTDMDTIENRIRYMKHGLGCDVVFLDHVSILVSGLTAETSNERTLIDSIVHRLRVLCSELDLPLILVSHLRRPSGDRGHENGDRVSLNQFRGSHGLVQLSDACVGLEVDAEDPTAGLRNLVVLKNRFTGEVGPAGQLQYDRDKGRLMSADNFMPF